MTTYVLDRIAIAGVLVAMLVSSPGAASDHADPMSLNVFIEQKDREANITDLHAFVVDADGRPLPAFDAQGRSVDAVDPFAEGRRLVVSLCVRPSLRPDGTDAVDLSPYRFRIHFDLSPPVEFLSPREKADAAETPAARRRRSMQARFGGIVSHPERIVDDAVLEFTLSVDTSGGTWRASLADQRAWGFRAPAKLERWAGGGISGDSIQVTADVFDDPFIFPRFFRTNVVGIVASIPVSNLMAAPPTQDPAPIMLWATSHRDGRQIDSVGRSLYTQLPRFLYLNGFPPSEQVREILRVHSEPSILWELLSSAISPLFAHRHYDMSPDVMIYDLRRPARFPNGRRLDDDVAKLLADAGETLLYELSFSDSRQFPRATINDKTFLTAFPYLAEAWTPKQVAAEAESLPLPPDAGATAPPRLDDPIWRQLFRGEVLGIAALTLLLLFAVRSWRWRVALVVASLAAVGLVAPILAANTEGSALGAAAQQEHKLLLLALGIAFIVVLLLGWFWALGRRFAPKRADSGPRFPANRQGAIADDARIHSYSEIHEALFDPDQCRPYYKVWGDPAQGPLPVYETTLASVAKDLFSVPMKPFAMERAARRTLQTRGDLRWGADRNGFRRLVHPMGVCLAGTWEIDQGSPSSDYTGYFAPGRTGRVIARYSVGGSDPEGGNHRSLGLVGKLFPQSDPEHGVAPRAHFITQEDLGGTLTDSIRQAVLTNSPPVTLLNRGRGLPAFLAVVVALMRADKQPSERQLYEIAELGKEPDEPTRCPRFMRLTITAPARSPGDERVDFRHEILGTIYDPGDPQPERRLEFAIEVSDEGRRTLLQRVVGQKWTRIGTLRFERAVASYNGDFVVHFHHPPWRRDRNDPDSVARRNLR